MSTPKPTCVGCGTVCDKARPTKDGGWKQPRGWKLTASGLRCRKCTQAAYYTRSIRVQIVNLKDSPAHRETLAAAAKASARFGNWYVQRLFSIDLAAGTLPEKTKDGKDKLPKLPEVPGWYGDAVAMFPELSGGCISGLAQQVRGWYSSRRYAALVALNRSVENYRFGFLPVEVRKQDWSLGRNAEGRWTIKASVCPGQRLEFDVWADTRALAQLRQIAAGEATALSCKIIRASKRPPAGSNLPPRKAWFFRLGVMFPRAATNRRARPEITLQLGRDAGCLLYGVIEGDDEPFEFPGVALRKLIVGGDRSDRAHQQENSLRRGLWSKRKCARWATDRTAMSAARQRKIAAQVKLCAAALTRWCVGHGVTAVDYEQTDRGFLPHCPWRALADAIRNALEPADIALHLVGDDATDQEESEALAGPEHETAGTLEAAGTSSQSQPVRPAKREA